MSSDEKQPHESPPEPSYEPTAAEDLETSEGTVATASGVMSQILR